MLIENTNLRRIVSLLFVLCLLFCLVPTMAFAEEYITKEVEDNPDNLESLVSGSIWINQKALYSNEKNGQIVFNYGYVGNNCGTIGTSAAYGDPSLDGYANGHIYNNSGTITINYGKVTNNYGTIGTNGVYDKSGAYAGVVNVNYDTIENNNSHVNFNFGTVEDNSNGTVTYNCGGTVKNGNDPVYECFYLEIDYDLYEEYPDNNSEESGVVYTDNRGTYYMLWGVQDKPLTLELDIKPGYEPYISQGSGSIVKNDDGTYTISASLPGITVGVRPISTGSVPATADMSNVPLWSAMLLVFAATAILTRKKKKG